MKIQIPEQFMGRKIEGAIERVLGKKSEQKQETPEQDDSNVQDLSGYIYVPSIKLHVAKERTLPNLTWAKTQEELKRQKLAMPTPYQFKEFLKYVRDSKNPEHERVFKDVVEVRDPWRAQWLNAKFEKRKNGLYMISENVLVNGKYETEEQKLDDFFVENKTPGISLDDWINSNAKHGLPHAKIAQGKLYYWAPVSGYVAGFGADSDWAGLSCDWVADGSVPSLGVRACAEGAVTKK